MRPLELGRTPIAKVRNAEALVDAIARVTKLTPRAIRNRVTRTRRGRTLVRSVFEDHWPSRLDELGAEPGKELAEDRTLLAELARLLGGHSVDISKRLRASPDAPARESLRDAWPDARPMSRATILDMSVQQARGRGNLEALAKEIGVEPARFARRIGRAHGSMLVARAVEDLLLTDAGSGNEGSLFDRYELTGKEWPGGFGVVREARDLRPPGRLVVLKWPRGGANTTKALEKEYAFAVDLRHEGLVSYYDFERAPDGMPVLVIEHGGEALRDRLERKRYSVPDAIALCRKLANALDYLSKRQRAHLDLHPGNVLIDDKGEPRITDFGISRHLRGSPGETSVTSAVPGHFPGFAAPEVERRTGTRRSDQYSLAFVFLSCVCGVHGGFECFDNHVFPRTLTRAQVAAFKRATSSSPANRFPTCMAFVDAMEEARKPALLEVLFGSR
jgi:hypothetical protein